MKSPTTYRANSSSSGTRRIGVQLLTFFAATFLIAWGAWIPLFVTPHVPRQVAFVGLFAPAFAGLMTASIYGGRGSVREIIQRISIVSFSQEWALLSALIMPAIYFAALGVLRVLHPGGTVPLFAGNSPFFITAGFIWLVFVTSGEEVGWRGFALPRLLQCSNRPVLISIGFGFVWGLWHLPLYLLPGQSAFPLPLFLIFTSVQGVLYTVIFIRTKGSLVPAVLLHAGTDIAPRVFQLSHLPVVFWGVVDLMLALVTTGLVLGMRKKLNDTQFWRAETASQLSK